MYECKHENIHSQCGRCEEIEEAVAAERERCARIANEWKIPKGHVLDHPMHDGELEIVMQVRMGIAIAITR